MPHPDKKDFQLERLILFSDAVFAIAITLLVIDLKVPEIAADATDSDFMSALGDQFPQLIGFVMSFFIIGLYWTVHHTMFGYVVNYTSKLLWLNLLYLFCVVLMPFSTAVYSEYSFSEEHFHLLAPYGIYVFNIVIMGIMNMVLNEYIFKPSNHISEHVPENYLKYARNRSIIIPLSFLFSFFLSFVDPVIGRMSLGLIPIAMSIWGRDRNKKPARKRR